MIKKFMLSAVLAASVAVPAQALTFSTQQATTVGVNGALTAPAGTLVDLSNPSANGFTLTTTGTTGVQSGSNANGAQPANSGATPYFFVTGGASAKFQSTAAYQFVSFYLGSIDAYNTFDVLSTTGAVLGTFVGSQFTNPDIADGGQGDADTNRRVTIARSGADAAIGGLTVRSSANSAEFTNLVFGVPEPQSWALMILGFGVIGLTVRARRRKTGVVFA